MLFVNALGAPIYVRLDFLTRTEGVKKKKFKNSYAGWIWAAFGTSLFWVRVDLAWIFAFFFNVAFSEMIKEFGAFCERAGCPNLRCARFFDPHGRREENSLVGFALPGAVEGAT